MPRIGITGERGDTADFSVKDKSEAIRILSSRLTQVFPNKYVEKCLNDWLESGMRVHLHMGRFGDKFVIVYRD